MEQTEINSIANSIRIENKAFINIAASSGYKLAVNGRGLVAKQMSRSQIEKAQKLARQYVKKK